MTPGILALVPTISPQRIRAAGPWLRALRAEGIDVHIVANAASVASLASSWEAPLIDSRANPGFARSIGAAVAAVAEPEWVVLLNDDLVMPEDAPARIRSVLCAAPSAGGCDIVYFDPEPQRPLPGRWGVFATLSLVEPVLRRLTPSSHRARVRPGYKSFSAVAVRYRTWAELGGLDRRFVFCFEDAFFVRAHLARGGSTPRSVDVGVSHHKSSTTSRHIAHVLPAVAFSARTYLEAVGVHPRAADAVVVAALLVRVPLALFGSASPRAHVRGVSRAIGAIVRRREPSLPAYELL
ncbi:hypothetical protein ACIPVB_15325 [Microbacterium sp. NPDC090007]|uniref:hypothetical protein n=1 Tax=Microbacterium sp. NPDC090007 TaxID=3364204 RepID=UPI00381D448D